MAKQKQSIEPVPSAETTKEGPFVLLTHFVPVRMPVEPGKPADRYAVVKVTAKAYVSEGVIIEDGLQLVYAKKRVSLEVTKDADERRRSVVVVA